MKYVQWAIRRIDIKQGLGLCVNRELGIAVPCLLRI